MSSTQRRLQILNLGKERALGGVCRSRHIPYNCKVLLPLHFLSVSLPSLSNNGRNDNDDNNNNNKVSELRYWNLWIVDLQDLSNYSGEYS